MAPSRSPTTWPPRRGRRDRSRPPARPGRDPVVPARRPRLGRLHRLLRRPRRLPLGDRVEPRTDRTGGAAVSATGRCTAQVAEARGSADWRLLFQACTRASARAASRPACALVAADRRGRRGAGPPPRPRPALRALDVRLSSHDVSGVTARDVGLARRISASPPGRDGAADPRRSAVLELALDTADAGAIKPFWRAVLGLADSRRRRRARRPATARCRPCGSRRPTPTTAAPAVPPRRPGAAGGGPGRVDAAARRPAARWSATSGPRRSGCSPTPQGNRACVTTWQGREG